VQQRVDLLRHEINKLREEEKVVDDYVAQMTELVQQSMRDQEAQGDKSLAYVTHADITSIPQYANDTVVAVKAPAGTTLEVPDPDEDTDENLAATGQRRYQIFLRTEDEKGIDTQLVNNPADGLGMTTEHVSHSLSEDAAAVEQKQDAAAGAASAAAGHAGAPQPEFQMKLEVEPLRLRGSFDDMPAGMAEQHVEGIDELFAGENMMG